MKTVGLPTAAADDVFAYTHRVPGLIALLEECALPFVAAVEGEWGRGKSSFLQMFIEHLKKSCKQLQRQWTVVRYHPWRYDIRGFDDAWESLVEVIDRKVSGPKAGDQATELIQRVAENRWARLVWRLGLPAVGLLVPGASAVTKGVEALGDQFQRYLQGPEHFGPGFLIFERAREQLVELAREHPLLIVVDDLDRCPPATVSQVLRCIATLFAPTHDGPKVAFLLALDRYATIRSLMKAEGWEEEYASQFLEKIVHVHVTLPIVGIGEGDKAASVDRLAAAIRGEGHRRSRSLEFPGVRVQFEIPQDRIDAIVRFLQFNPRRIERFCILFDLKWSSRFEANATVAQRKEDWRAQSWLDRFRDRLIWESLIELRWPLYDAKTGVIKENKQAIEKVISGKKIDARGLPCAPFLADSDFLALHKLYFRSWSVAATQPG